MCCDQLLEDPPVWLPSIGGLFFEQWAKINHFSLTLLSSECFNHISRKTDNDNGVLVPRIALSTRMECYIYKFYNVAKPWKHTKWFKKKIYLLHESMYWKLQKKQLCRDESQFAAACCWGGGRIREWLPYLHLSFWGVSTFWGCLEVTGCNSGDMLNVTDCKYCLICIYNSKTWARGPM